MKTCALVCGAGFAQEDFCARRERGEFDCVVAVDSGYEHLRALGERANVREQTYAGVRASVSVCVDAGVLADAQAGIDKQADENKCANIVLGDFDSLGFVPEGAVVSSAIKDKSDLELALDWACEQGFRDVIVYGCLGARIDHTIAALQTLASVAERGGVRVRAVGERVGGVSSGVNFVGVFLHEENASQYAKGTVGHANIRSSYTEVLEVLVGPVTLMLRVADDSKPEVVPALGAPTFGNVSVFSAGAQAIGVSLTGMYYSLDNATLNNRTSLGLSNELVEREGVAHVQKGTLYVVYPSSFCTEVEFSTDFECNNQK